MKKVEIIKIEWEDNDSGEAFIKVSDGKFNLEVFAHPWCFGKGYILKHPLLTMNAKNISLSIDKATYATKLNAKFSYELVGILLSRCRKLVQVGDISIELDTPIPKDIQEGQFIKFRCERLDFVA